MVYRRTKTRRYRRKTRSRYNKRKGYRSRRYRRRSYKGKYRRGGQFNVVQGKKYVKCTYVSVKDVAINSYGTLGALIVLPDVMVMNAPIDPDTTTGGAFNDQKSAGFKFWSTLYNHYRVVKSKLVTRIRQSSCLAASTTPSPLVVCGVKLDDNGTLTGYNGWEQFSGDPLAKYKFLSLGQTGETSKGVKLTSWYRDKTTLANRDNSGAATNAVPADLWYAITYLQMADKVEYTALPSLQIVRTMTMWVEFTEPKDMITLNNANALIQTS